MSESAHVTLSVMDFPLMSSDDVIQSYQDNERMVIKGSEQKSAI